VKALRGLAEVFALSAAARTGVARRTMDTRAGPPPLALEEVRPPRYPAFGPM
jgi:hypothetical protein